MRHAGKRIVSSLCALALLAAMLPAQAMATGTTEPGASVQQELSETSDGETKTDTDAGNVSGQEGGENQNDLNGSEGRDDQTPNEEEKESTAEGGETDLSEDEKDEKTDGADLSGDDTTEADGSREPADGENDSGSQNGQNGGAEQGNLPPSNDGAETMEEPVNLQEGTEQTEPEQESGSTAVDVEAAYIITAETENIQTILNNAKAAGKPAMIKGGTYGSGFTVSGITLYVNGEVQLSSGISLTNATLQGVTGRDTDKIVITNTTSSVTVNSATLQNVTLDVSGNVHNYLLYWQSGEFVVKDSYLSASNNTNGSGMFVSGSKFIATNSTVKFDHNVQGNDGSGIWANADGNANAEFEFTGCTVSMSNNGLNGFMGAPAPLFGGTAPTPRFTFINSNVEVTGNGSPTDGGEGDGFSYGYITLKNTDDGNYTFNISGNDNNGLDGGRGNNAALNANGYKIIANDNGGIGINVSKLNEGQEACTLTNCTVEANGNGSYGIQLKQPAQISGSTITANENGNSGFRFYSSSGSLTLDESSSLTVRGNAKSGLYFYGKSATLDGVLTAQRNQDSGVYISRGSVAINNSGSAITVNQSATYGGGIRNAGTSYSPTTVTLADGVKLYDNNADKGGDDLYNAKGGTASFYAVGEGWTLDDCNLVKECPENGMIDGWYDDTEGTRWDAHDGNGIYHVEKFNNFEDDGKATVNGPLSLKAAHGASATLQPADITIYMGGEDGYDGVLGNGEAQSSNSLPTPGFYFTLPADLNQVLSNALGKDPTTAIDLSGLVTVTATGDDNKARTWKLERYGVEGGSSTAIVDEASGLEHFIYKIVPVEDEQDPVRVQFTDPETGETIISDKFDPDTALHNEYTMELYTGGVNPNSITMEFTLPEEKGGQTYTCGYDQENSKSGTLTVRYANNDALIIDAVEDMDAAIAKEDEMFYVEADSDQSFFINEQDLNSDKELTGVEVDFTDVSLLADDIITQERADALYDRAEQAAESAGLENVNMFAKYFDLVDKENGNAWLTPADGETVTVYWPYPAGTDKNTEFKLYHFEGLDREMQVEDVEREVYDAEMVDMKITKGETGITFETGSFSPFVLAWENPAEQPSGGSGSEENPAPTATPQPTPAPAEAEPVAAPAAAAVPQTGDDMPIALLGVSAAGAAVVFVALLAVRKRRHGQD